MLFGAPQADTEIYMASAYINITMSALEIPGSVAMRAAPLTEPANKKAAAVIAVKTRENMVVG